MATGVETDVDNCQVEEEQPSDLQVAGPAAQHRQDGERYCSGHECDFVNPPPFQTECPICYLVLRSPHLTSCCGNNLCKECIERVRKAGKCCHLCNGEQFTLTYNRVHDVSLKKSDVYCTHRKVGCEWKGKLETLANHLNVDPEHEKQLEGCAFVEVQCYHDGCGESFQRQLITKHQSEECSKRWLSCDYCHDYTSTQEDILVNHWPVCKCYPVSCPHNCTPKSIQRQNLQGGDHLKKECPLQVVECEFKYAGCETELPRKDIPNHLKENIDHMTLLARQNQRLARENQELMAKLLKEEDHIRRMAEEMKEKSEERDRQINELANQYQDIEQEKNEQIWRLLGDAQAMRQRMNKIEEAKDTLITADVANLEDEMWELQQRSAAVYNEVKGHITETEKRGSTAMTKVERHIVQLENGKASATEVKELKDRIVAVEERAITKAEHEKLTRQVVTRREFEDLVRRQDATDSSLKALQTNATSVAEFKKSNEQVLAIDHEGSVMMEAEHEKLTHQVATKRALQDQVANLTQMMVTRRELDDLARKQDTTSSSLEKLLHHVPIAPVQIVMPNFEQNKRNKDSWYSDGFYTHPQGYKLCLRVDGNGNGNGEGTHVSFFIYLMHGEFDNHLKWPFRGIVTIQLFNQQEDNNRAVSVNFDDNEWSKRVTTGERAGSGWGSHKFIPHSELNYTTATNCKYLVNDCLYFRVNVKLR